MPQFLRRSINHGEWTQSERINTHLGRIFDRVNGMIGRELGNNFILHTLNREMSNYAASCEKAFGNCAEQDRLLKQGIKYSDLDLARHVLSGWKFMAMQDD